MMLTSGRHGGMGGMDVALDESGRGRVGTVC